MSFFPEWLTSDWRVLAGVALIVFALGKGGIEKLGLWDWFKRFTQFGSAAGPSHSPNFRLDEPIPEDVLQWITDVDRNLVAVGLTEAERLQALTAGFSVAHAMAERLRKDKPDATAGK